MTATGAGFGAATLYHNAQQWQQGYGEYRVLQVQAATHRLSEVPFQPPKNWDGRKDTLIVRTPRESYGI
jgi:hypothetical protein